MGSIDNASPDQAAARSHPGLELRIAGIAGLVLPFLQGLLLIMLGLIILSSEYDWARRLLAKLEARFPKIGSAAHMSIANVNRWRKRHSFRSDKE